MVGLIGNLYMGGERMDRARWLDLSQGWEYHSEYDRA